MSEQVAEVLAAHQRVSTLSDACMCGAGDLDALQETGVAMRGHWRHVALVIESLIAERERAAAERALRPVAAILEAWMSWDGSPGPGGRIHPDASSPRDRDRLSAALRAAQANPNEEIR